MNNDIDQMHFLVLHIGEACCRENWNYKNICSPFTRIYYVRKATHKSSYPTKTRFAPRIYVYYSGLTTHSYVCHGEFCHYYIHIYNESDHDILEDWELPTEIRTANEMLSYIRKLNKLCPGLELTQTDPQYYDNSPALTRNILKKNSGNCMHGWNPAASSTNYWHNSCIRHNRKNT